MVVPSENSACPQCSKEFVLLRYLRKHVRRHQRQEAVTTTTPGSPARPEHAGGIPVTPSPPPVPEQPDEPGPPSPRVSPALYPDTNGHATSTSTSREASPSHAPSPPTPAAPIGLPSVASRSPSISPTPSESAPPRDTDPAALEDDAADETVDDPILALPPTTPACSASRSASSEPHSVAHQRRSRGKSYKITGAPPRAECSADTTLLYQRPAAPEPIDAAPFTAEEVLFRLRKAENTAPGSDRLTPHHWKSVDPEARFLSAFFNACVHHRRTPDAWRTFRTVLIFKKGGPRRAQQLETHRTWQHGIQTLC
ncbi:hypothetical protein MTO96_006708 [Rhipicephalus appendiculatus]